jgi:hypothetical protein
MFHLYKKSITWVFTEDQERLRLNESILVTEMTLISRFIWICSSHGQLNPSWFPNLPTMWSMHPFQPASSASISWYPTLVGSYWVSHKVLMNPNSSHATMRWTNLPHSTSFILIIPKFMEIIMDKVWFRNVTIWTIFAHVTLLTAFIANAAFILIDHTIPQFLFHAFLWALFLEKGSSLPGLLEVGLPWQAPVGPVTCTGLTSHGQCTAHCCIWARVGKVSLLSAHVAHPPLVGASRLLGECWRWKSVNLAMSLPSVLAWVLYLIHWY